jgi:hypothetical protein
MTTDVDPFTVSANWDAAGAVWDASGRTWDQLLAVLLPGQFTLSPLGPLIGGKDYA